MPKTDKDDRAIREMAMIIVNKSPNAPGIAFFGAKWVYIRLRRNHRSPKARTVKLNKLLPITFPTAKSGLLMTPAVIFVVTSGKEVAPAIKTAPVKKNQSCPYVIEWCLHM